MILIGIDTGVKTGFAHSIDGVLQEVSTQTILSAQDRVLEIRDEAAQSDVELVVCIEDVRKRTWVDPSIGKERLKGVGQSQEIAASGKSSVSVTAYVIYWYRHLTSIPNAKPKTSR